MSEDRFAPGFAITLRPDVIRDPSGRILVGGSPVRAVTLAPAAQRLFDGDRLVVRDRATALLAARLLDGNLAEPELAALGVPPEDLTVVIPVRDRPDQLDRALDALRPLHCLVVDDDSRDRHAVRMVADRHGAHYVPLPANLGPAGARNAGLRLVRTPYVAFVDSDVEVTPATLLGLARHFADQRVGLVGPWVRGVTRSDRPRWFERFDATAASLDLGRRGCMVRPGAAVAWLPSACLVARVDVLGDGFDADLRVGEDVDLVWRLAAAGVGVRYDPDRSAGHDVRSTIGSWLGRKFVYGTGGGELGRRHGDAIAPAELSPAATIAAAALLARRWWSVPAAGVALLVTSRGLARALPAGTPPTVPVRLAVRGLGWALRQESALLLRHWWPATTLASCVSPAVRRAVATATVVDLAVFLRERPETDPVTALAGRRLDDLAYGAGLWWGALRAANLQALLPRRSGAPRRRDR